MGKYDLPAVFDYVLAKTGMTSLSYVGHSMGCTMFFICMIDRPEYNAKIDVMIALAPAVANIYSKTSIRYQAPLVKQIEVYSIL